jgi:hypothetical protein
MERLNRRDAALGLIFILIGIAFAIGSRSAEIGTAFRMGPGYFPLLLSTVLMHLGGIIVAGSFKGANELFVIVPWRGLLLVLAAPVIFGLTVRKLGLAPAIVLTVVLSVFASQRSSLRLVGAMAIGLTLFCVAVFSYGLRLPLPLFGPWMRF